MVCETFFFGFPTTDRVTWIKKKNRLLLPKLHSSLQIPRAALGPRPSPTLKTTMGIVLPTFTTSSPLPEATVIAAGPGAPDKEGRIVFTSVKAGDRVLLAGWRGNAIIRFVRELEVLIVLPF